MRRHSNNATTTSSSILHGGAENTGAQLTKYLTIYHKIVLSLF